jgi:hypothetical protein
MAMRSGGGTGVLVALIIFIFLTVGSATAAILLYGQKNSAEEKAQARAAELREVIKESEKDRDDVAKLNQGRGQKSLVGHMMERSKGFRNFVTGDPNADEDSTRSRFNIPAEMTLQQAITRMQQDNSTLQSRVETLEGTLKNREDQLASGKQDYSQLQMDSDRRVGEVQDSIQGYRTAADEYRAEIRDTQDKYVRAIDDKERDHRNKVDQLQSEIDDLRGNHTVVTSRLNELRKVVDAIRIRPKNPAELVDGRVVDVLGSSGQVFIDLGRKDRIKPGMTFEVYDDPGQIRIDSNTGEYSRGKASIQVIKVADSTATARVTRTSGSRPVVRDDVIANAVFNPEYRFKFLVYGKFDVDSNGAPTENEADFIRSRIIEWGGEVVDGQQLTGDLDFVVLGEVPDYVSTELIPSNASNAQIQAIMDKRAAYDQYEELFQQAINAQIPVLNWNRFRILTGETE